MKINETGENEKLQKKIKKKSKKISKNQLSTSIVFYECLSL